MHHTVGVIVLLHYRCRDIGYGIDGGTVAGHFTGERDVWGKNTFKRDDGDADMYLFDDEIISAVPVLADDQRECPQSSDGLHKPNLSTVTVGLEPDAVYFDVSCAVCGTSGCCGKFIVTDEVQW